MRIEKMENNEKSQRDVMWKQVVAFEYREESDLPLWLSLKQVVKNNCPFFLPLSASNNFDSKNRFSSKGSEEILSRGYFIASYGSLLPGPFSTFLRQPIPTKLKTTTSSRAVVNSGQFVRPILA